MTLFRFTPQAEADLFDVWSYIASGNPAAADRV
jgi:plasmid stabilization system protein ParE